MASKWLAIDAGCWMGAQVPEHFYLDSPDGLGFSQEAEL